MAWIFIVLTVAAFLLGFPAAEYAVHGWHHANWPVGVRAPAAWFTAMWTSYGRDSLKAYYMLATGGTTSFGRSSWPVLLCIFVGPLVALILCFVRQAGVDARRGKTFRRAWALAGFIALIVSVGIATAVSRTPEQFVWLDQDVLLPVSFAGGHREKLLIRKGSAVAKRGRAASGLVRLQVWYPDYGYGVADVSEEFIRLHARF